MVDHDKQFSKQPYLATFTQVVRGGFSPHDTHAILQHPERPEQHLIVMNPACDTWLWRCAAAAGIDLSTIGLPADRLAFIDFCKQPYVNETRQMQRLLHVIRQARPAPYRELADFVAGVMDLHSGTH